MTNRQKLESLTDEELAFCMYYLLEERELEIRRETMLDLGINSYLISMAPQVHIQHHINWLNEECDPEKWRFRK